jgi:hypothetical protein
MVCQCHRIVICRTIIDVEVQLYEYSCKTQKPSTPKMIIEPNGISFITFLNIRAKIKVMNQTIT